MKKQTIVLLFSSLVILFGGTYFFKNAMANELPIVNSVVSNSNSESYKLGDAVKDFSLRSTSGENVSLADYESARGFIVVFTCNHCPFSKAYEDRVIALNNKYMAMGFPVIAINPNDPAAYEEDSFENMKARAEEKTYTFPYLEDTAGVGQQFGAARTPHVFVLQKLNGQAIVRYIGAIDDSAQDPAGVSKKYVENAVDNLLNGRPVETQTTRAIGCAIKWRS